MNDDPLPGGEAPVPDQPSGDSVDGLGDGSGSSELPSSQEVQHQQISARVPDHAAVNEMVNIARHLKVNPELALRRANAKFRDRFAYVEDGLRRHGKSLETAELEEMEQLWQQAKKS